MGIADRKGMSLFWHLKIWVMFMLRIFSQITMFHLPASIRVLNPIASSRWSRPKGNHLPYSFQHQ